VNFEQGAVVGNNGGQNQTGLSVNPAGSGSLRWTDKGNGGNTALPSGAAISWGNGTIFEGDSFNERLSDFSNYNYLIIRMSATDALNGGGILGVQGFFQTANEANQSAWIFQTASGGGVGQFGEVPLAIDGQFHNLVIPLASINDRANVNVFGINLFSHMNDLTINVDNVQFAEENPFGLAGDHDGDGDVDTADYVVWRATEIDGAQGYTNWAANYGASGGSGSGSLSAVPEPAGLLLVLMLGCTAIASRRSQRL
jgi:hypothetical protein